MRPPRAQIFRGTSLRFPPRRQLETYDPPDEDAPSRGTQLQVHRLATLRLKKPAPDERASWFAATL